jgi:dynein heavy chain
MALLLEKTKSSYYPAFNELFKETCDALEEAQDIDSHLKPLAGFFESLETGEFDEIADLFDPMFHTVCLVWAHSRFYCRPARIIVLLQELNNLIMRRAGEYLEPIDLFKGEPEESIDKIKKTYATLDAYQKSYDTHKLKVLSYFKNGIPPKDWEFAPKIVMARWDKFMDRMNMIRV